MRSSPAMLSQCTGVSAGELSGVGLVTSVERLWVLQATERRPGNRSAMFLSLGLPRETTVPKSSFLATSSYTVCERQIVSGSAKVCSRDGDIHPITKHISVFLYDVAEMDADADVNLLGFLVLGVTRPQLR